MLYGAFVLAHRPPANLRAQLALAAFASPAIEAGVQSGPPGPRE